MKALLTAVLIPIAAATIASACRAESFMVGAGSNTCGQFANYYAQNPEAAEVSFFTWAQGFMSSMNIKLASGSAPTYRDLSGPIEIQKSHIRIYCNAHPLVPYFDAVDDLFGSLPQKPMPAKK